ncbi:MAG: zinc ABC transporter substrate-binding protein [Desulfomonile sp.]
MNHRFDFRFLPLLFSTILSPFLCGTSQAEGIKAFVAVLPQAYFVERLGGNHVEVRVLVGPGQDAHTYELSPKMVTELAGARVFFGLGLPFETAIVKKITPIFDKLEVVDTTRGIPFRAFQEEEEHEHGVQDRHEEAIQGPEHHNRGESDPHVWMDPKLVKIQASNIANALIRIDPSNSSEYAKNLAEFQAELDELDLELSRALAPVRGQRLYVYHPGYGYFADAYGLQQVSVETGGKEPSARHLASLIRRAKKDGATVIFVQPQFSRKSAEALANAIGGVVIPIDPLARDYMSNMKQIAVRVKSALEGRKDRSQ